MADTIEITLEPGQLDAYLSQTERTLEDMIAGRMDAVMEMFEDRVKANLSGGVLQTQSGALLGSVMRTPTQQSGDDLYASVAAGGDAAPYGIYFEEGGSGYYDIVPINARVLAFMMQGQQVFASIVDHPPTPKLPWFGIEIDPIREIMETELNAVFSEVLKS